MDSSRDIVKRLRENRLLTERTNYEGKSTEELVNLAKDGDQLAFNTLINTHEEFFYKMTKKYVAEGVFERDDILQIAEIAFWEAIQSWNGSGDFEAYAGMVVKRRLVDEYRKQFTDKSIANRGTTSIEGAESGDDEDGPGEMSKSEYDSYLSNAHRSAEDEYLDKAMEEQLVKFFSEEMTEIERKLIRMYLDGYKMSQIAEETGVKYKSCENAVRRAKEKLRDFLSNMKESKKLREGNESIFSEEESKILKTVLSKIDRDMKESKEMNESETKDLRDKIYDKFNKANGQTRDKYNMIFDEFGVPNEEQNFLSSVSDNDVKDIWDQMNESTEESKELEEYTDDEFEDLLVDIIDELESLIEEIKTVSKEDRYSDILDEIDRLKDKVSDCEYFMNPDNSHLSKLSDEAHSLIWRAKDTTPEGLKPRDPYAEVGMSPRDFF